MDVIIIDRVKPQIRTCVEDFNEGTLWSTGAADLEVVMSGRR